MSKATQGFEKTRIYHFPGGAYMQRLCYNSDIGQTHNYIKPDIEVLNG